MQVLASCSVPLPPPMPAGAGAGAGAAAAAAAGAGAGAGGQRSSADPAFAHRAGTVADLEPSQPDAGATHDRDACESTIDSSSRRTRVTWPPVTLRVETATREMNVEDVTDDDKNDEERRVADKKDEDMNDDDTNDDDMDLDDTDLDDMDAGEMDAGVVISAHAIAVPLTAARADRVISGAPRTGAVDIDEDMGLGVWEMTPGAVRDTEVSEVFVVVSGSATVDFIDPALPSIELTPGAVVRLESGMQTVWTVHETLRRVYLA